MNPELGTFLAHLDSALFQTGVDRGQWGLYTPLGEIVWPHGVIWVKADSKVMPSGRVYLRFDLKGYPLIAPTACPWDVEKGTALATGDWPKGNSRVNVVFNPNWRVNALYAPCDREAMEKHDLPNIGWPQKFPRYWWKPEFTIARYLEFISECLNRYQYEQPDNSRTFVVAAAA